MNNAPRGGDMMILYPDGTLRNLTREAGYGDSNEIQGKNSIAVRQPLFAWIDSFRTLAIRYEKKSINYLSFGILRALSKFLTNL